MTASVIYKNRPDSDSPIWWRHVSEPFELGLAEGESNGENQGGRLPQEQTNRRCRNQIGGSLVNEACKWLCP